MSQKKNFFSCKQSAGITSWCLFQFCGCSFVHYAWATFGNSLAAFPCGWRFLRRLALLVDKNQSVYIKSRLGMKMEPFFTAKHIRLPHLSIWTVFPFNLLGGFRHQDQTSFRSLFMNRIKPNILDPRRVNNLCCLP